MTLCCHVDVMDKKIWRKLNLMWRGSFDPKRVGCAWGNHQTINARVVIAIQRLLWVMECQMCVLCHVRHVKAARPGLNPNNLSQHRLAPPSNPISGINGPPAPWQKLHWVIIGGIRRHILKLKCLLVILYFLISIQKLFGWIIWLTYDLLV